ncbi:MAG TPA: hypothetical protein VF028_07525 [Actinomycetota bacterium]|nr:hypothetical protein [Actinomycetota bacterium]
MSDAPRWVVVILVVLVLVGLLAFARGREHRRGDDVGDRAAVVVVVSEPGSRA